MARFSTIAAATALAAALSGQGNAQENSTYRYDVFGRLTAATRAPANGGSFTRYIMDAADNRSLRQSSVAPMRTSQNELLANEVLLPDQKLVSLDNRFQLVLQTDGNLVLYFGSTALWSSNTSSGSSMYLVMQGDGNLVVYDPVMTPLWYAGTAAPGAKLRLQNDGNLVIYSGGAAIWSTGTCCH